MLGVMIQYEIISAWDKSRLVDEINTWLSKGWMLQGGASVAFKDGKPIFYQSMIKKVRESKKGSEISSDARLVIEYLSKRSGKTFSVGKVNAEYISARLSEGYTAQQLCRAVDNICGKWLGDPKMEMYIRPQTIFGKQKFESYLNAGGASKKFERY